MSRLVQNYLDADEKDYVIGVELVKAFAPGHPLLKSILQGNSFINQLYLIQALKNIVSGSFIPEALPVKASGAAKEDPNLFKLLKQQKKLILQRVHLSNSFHQYLQNPTQCAEISDKLRLLQPQIRAITKKIDHYNDFGVLPPDQTHKAKKIPTDRAEQVRKLSSLRSSRSIYRKKVRTEKDKKKLLKHQAKLTTLENDIKNIEDVINKK